MRVANIIPLAACLLSLGCSTPFSADVNGYDFEHEQAPAVVTFSDPQVFARETLVNDRRLEVEYLHRLLDASENVAFEPGLRRDLQTVVAFVAQANILDDPTAGAQFTRDQQRLDERRDAERIDAEAAVVRAQVTLLQWQRRLEALQGGALPDAPDPQTSGTTGSSPPPAQGMPAVPTTQTDVDALTLGELRSLLIATDRLKAMIQSASSGAPVRQAAVAASPSEIFRDRQTYREEIRAALADVNLDDAHDIAGNTLYRLQFRATVMPGQRRGQFAIARITLAPPAMTAREVADLYLSWLTYINHELNRGASTDPSVFHQDPDELQADNFQSEIELIGGFTGLFEIVEFDQGQTHGVVAAEHNAADYLRRAICASRSVRLTSTSCDQVPALTAMAAPPRLALQTTATPSPTEMRRCATDEQLNDIDETINAVREYQRLPTLALAMLVSATQGGLRVERRSDTLRRLVEFLRHDLSQRQQDARAASDAIVAAISNEHFDPACANAARLSDYVYELRLPWAATFAEHPDYLLKDTLPTFHALLQDPRDSERELSHATGNWLPVPRGDMASYFARPVDQSQRVSSIEGAANAIDLALALRAQTGGNGISGALGANFVRQAVGRIETIERAPIVVGFNDRIVVGVCEGPTLGWRQDCRSQGAPRALPQSGWVFGPPLTPAGAGSTLEARQTLVNQSVSTDISAPGWWPRVQATLETAWVRNWDRAAAGDPFRDRNRRSTRTFTIDLPHNAVDLHALTRVIAGLGTPLTSPEILLVTPERLRICPGATTLRIQVAGRNIWQSTEAYLNGVQATQVRVLPDMGGVDLVFPTANLPLQTTGGSGAMNAELVIWTRDDQVSRAISIQRADANTPFCVQEPATPHPAATAPLSVQTWIAPGGDFRAEVGNRTAYEARAEMRLEMRHFNPDTGEGFPTTWTPLAAENGSPALSANAAGVLGFTMPSAAMVGYDDGSLVQVQAVVRARDGTETRLIAPMRVAYFSAAEQTIIDTAAIAIPSPAAPFQVVVELPRRPDLRYPGLPSGDAAPDGSKIAIRGALMQGGQTFQFASTGAWRFLGRTNGKPRYGATVQLVGSDADATAFWTTLGTAGLPVQFSLLIANAQGTQTQAGQTVSVLVKRQ